MFPKKTERRESQQEPDIYYDYYVLSITTAAATASSFVGPRFLSEDFFPGFHILERAKPEKHFHVYEQGLEEERFAVGVKSDLIRWISLHAIVFLKFFG